MNKFLLQGVISPYDGAIFIGLFDSLEEAIDARSEFRKSYYAKYKSESYESYEIYEFKLGQIIENGISERPVDVFVPGKAKR